MVAQTERKIKSLANIELNLELARDTLRMVRRDRAEAIAERNYDEARCCLEEINTLESVIQELMLDREDALAAKSLRLAYFGREVW